MALRKRAHLGYILDYGSGKVKFYGYGQDRRCILCHLWRKNHGGEDRSVEAVLKSLSRKGARTRPAYLNRSIVPTMVPLPQVAEGAASKVVRGILAMGRSDGL